MTIPEVLTKEATVVTVESDCVHVKCSTLFPQSKYGGQEYVIPAALACYARLAVYDKERSVVSWKNLILAIKMHVSKNYPTRVDKDKLVAFAAIHAFTNVRDEIDHNNYVASKKRDYAELLRSQNWVTCFDKRRYLFLIVMAMALYEIKGMFPKLGALFRQFGWRTIKLAVVLTCFAINKDVVMAVLERLSCAHRLRQWCASTTKMVGVAGSDGPIAKKVIESPTIKQNDISCKPETTISVSGMLELPEKTLAASIMNSSVDFDIFIPDVGKKAYSNGEYTRTIYDAIVEKRGSDTNEGGDVCSLIKPQFIGKNEVVNFPLIVCEKPCDNNPDVIALAHRDDKKIGEYYQIGPCFLRCVPGAHALDRQNEFASLCGRHLIVKHADDIGEWRRVVGVALPYFDQFVDNVQAYTQHQWLCDQPPHKRDKYTAFLGNVSSLDFENPQVHKRNFFIKNEILVPGFGTRLADKFPRGIQGLLVPETNIALGPFMHVVSDAIASGFGGQLSYSSGRTPEELGEWFNKASEEGFSFYEDDFSAFDSTQGAGAHFAEVSVYKLFGPDHVVDTVLNYQKKTVGISKFFRYKTKFTRKSGDQNTSVGNTIINFMVHLYAIHEYNSRGNNVVFKMMALGDDNLLAVKNAGSDFCSYIEQVIVRLGLRPKFKQCSKAPTYCSSVFLPVVDGNRPTYVLVPELLRRLSKIGFTVKTLPRGVSPIARLKANELSMPNNRLLPVSRVFYNYYTSLSQIKADYDNDYRPHAIYTANFSVCERTFDWFTDVYGVSVDEINQLEDFLIKHLDSADGFPSVWNHPVANYMYDFYHA